MEEPTLKIFIFNLFIVGCAVFITICGLSLVVSSRDYSTLRCMGFSLQWLLLLWALGTWALVIVLWGENICKEHIYSYSILEIGLPMWLSVKESACKSGDMGSISGLEISPGEGNGNPLQYSCLGNPMEEELCRLQSMGGSQKSQTQLSN